MAKEMMDNDDIRELFCEVVETAVTANASRTDPAGIARQSWKLLHTFGLQVTQIPEDEEAPNVVSGGVMCSCQCFACRHGQHHLCVVGCPYRPDNGQR